MPFDALNDASDEALLVAYGNGDRQAARALTSRLTPRIIGYATRLIHDRVEAEDVTQEAMLRLWRIAPIWRQGEAKITTWLYRVVTNLCTDRLRKRCNVTLDDIKEPESGASSVLGDMIETERQSVLQRALDKLPPRQKQAVILRHIEELSNPDIAGVMDISVEAVESLTARGKRALAQDLSGLRTELGYEDDG